MIIKTHKDIPSSEITDKKVFNERRTLIKAMLVTAVGATMPSAWANNAKPNAWDLAKSDLSNTALTPTPIELVKNYTNYYEFTLNKEDSTKLAQNFIVDPWSLE
ncbi:MAG: mononuclear molybdenum enzyme YedY, partial [Methylococcaceae bacterium]